jgi:hypothetical protein
MRCRACGAGDLHLALDLGRSPLANDYLDPSSLDGPETSWPLRVRRCGACGLVQLPAFEAPERIFGDYAYFSSFSTSWVAHAGRIAAHYAESLCLGAQNLVVEVASNDGYLLRHFVDRGIPSIGVEPAANVAEVARARGVDTRVAFLGADTGAALAAEVGKADLVLGLNVLAHVPDLHDFVAGLSALVADEGVVHLEFPHLYELVRHTQFDTVYHEHFSYLSVGVVEQVLAAHDLAVFDVARVPTHGGSVQVRAGRPGRYRRRESVDAVLADERAARLGDAQTWQGLTARVLRVKHDLVRYLLDARAAGRTVLGYGAPAKGNTMLNFCGVGPDLLPFTVDANPAKQGKVLPGSRIPVRAPSDLFDARPAAVLVLPWNLVDEIRGVLAPLGDVDVVTAVPSLTVSRR